MRIAFFDLDRTLIEVNSAKGWIRREIRLGHLRWRDAIRGTAWIGAYHMGFSRLDAAIRDAVGSLQGSLEVDLRDRTTDYWREEIVHAIRPGARRAVETHRERGDRLALLTTSTSYLGELVAEELGLDDILCNRFEVVEGMFTGQPIEPLCYGPGKLEHARALAERLGAALEDCSFYTDSYSDLPVLQAVGEPVVVHPDPRLAREARRRSWPIVDWQQ